MAPPDGTGNGGTLTAQTSTFVQGAAAALVSGRTNTWNGPAQNVLSSLRSGARVGLTAWIRVNMTTPAALRVAATIDLGSGTDAANRYPEISGVDLTAAQVGTWVKLQTSWNQSVLPTWTTASDGKFYINANNATADLYVDAVTFVVEPL
ncbi:MAG: carbohydrate binding domain-containing protein [Polyangiaceae bacterium]